MNILLGFDGSAMADQAITEVIALSELAEDVTVILYDINEDSLADIDARIQDQLESNGIDAEIRHAEENAGAQIVETAESEGFDRIVVPGGSRSPLGKIQLNDVVEFVLLNAQTSVTLAR